jgi:hypothetical protein
MEWAFPICAWPGILPRLPLYLPLSIEAEATGLPGNVPNPQQLLLSLPGPVKHKLSFILVCKIEQPISISQALYTTLRIHTCLANVYRIRRKASDRLQI